MTSPDPALRLLRKLARMNRLANRRLQAACARLPPGAFLAPRTGFFPSLAATLNHILVIDRFYVDALEGGTLGPAAWADPVPCPDVPALAAAQDAVDLRLLAFVEGLRAQDLAREVRIHRGTRVQVERVDDTLSHLFQHQTHHRGQAHVMLSGTAVAPPQLDEFIVADDAVVRAADLAALGWTERDLMETG
jgi:uncharacterized damage-inducible protein DinB